MQIVLGNKEEKLTFNMGFLRLLVKEYNIDPLNLGSLDGTKYMDLGYAIIYCGIAITAKIEGKEQPSKLDVEALVDEMHPSDINEVVMGLMDWIQTPKKLQTGEAVSSKETFPVG